MAQNLGLFMNPYFFLRHLLFRRKVETLKHHLILYLLAPQGSHFQLTQEVKTNEGTCLSWWALDSCMVCYQGAHFLVRRCIFSGEKICMDSFNIVSMDLTAYLMLVHQFHSLTKMIIIRSHLTDSICLSSMKLHL